MPPSTPAKQVKPQQLFNDGKGKNGAATEKSSHIEVCARIRPLQITMQSSASYFHDRPKKGSSIPSPARKPQVPKKGITPPKASTRKAPLSQKSQPSPAPVQGPEDGLFYAWDVMGNDTATQSPRTDIVPGRTHSYTLDKVYAPSCNTKEMYNQSVKPLVYSAMEGYHSAVLAYGQTSTGKTFSMTGTPTSPGIIPLAIHQCFQCLENDREYLIRVSYLEVYKEQIRDLLAEGASQIRLFDHREQGLIIKGLREEVVTCPKQIFEILAQGEKRRKIGATNMNQHSSRSHVMVRLWIESRGIEGGKRSGNSSFMANTNNSKKGGTPVRVSSLSLVDLAGSESVKLHGANEARRQEGHYINKSLMALGKVVYALSEMGKQQQKKGGAKPVAPQHIPYRDSKLTRLLQPSLSGNAQMVLICCISPLAKHVEESHNTFKFAARAKKVPQKATIQESVDEKTLLQTYREEIEALKQQLKDAKVAQDTLLKAQREQEIEVVLEDDDIDDEVEELKVAIRNMEHLILKSKATTPPPISTALSDDELLDAVMADDEDDLDDNNNNDEEALLALMSETQKSSGTTRSPLASTNKTNTTPPRTPKQQDTTSDMHAELHRIQGLLGSVLKKRSRTPKGSANNNNNGPLSPSRSFNDDPVPRASNGKNAAEVQELRAQLQEQEVNQALKVADATFLQNQLEEKDNLLAEVSKILEQVENRQLELEAENEALKKQVAALRSGASPITILKTSSHEC